MVVCRQLDLVACTGNNDSTTEPRNYLPFTNLLRESSILGDPNGAISISILRFSESRLIGNGEFRGRLCRYVARVCLTSSNTGSQEPAISLKYSDFIASVST